MSVIRGIRLNEKCMRYWWKWNVGKGRKYPYDLDQSDHYQKLTDKKNGNNKRGWLIKA